MKEFSMTSDGEEFIVKTLENATDDSIHLVLPDYDRAEGVYMSAQTARILGLALVAIADPE